MKDKRGISPVVATVLLIAIVVVIGLIIFLWARAFLSESAVKNDRSVEISCADVQFEYEIVPDDVPCGSPALHVNNIGNIPLYGFRVFEWDESLGNLVADDTLDGSISIGESDSLCLSSSVGNGDAFRVIPKLLAENDDGGRVVYTCPEKDGITIAYVGN